MKNSYVQKNIQMILFKLLPVKKHIHVTRKYQISYVTNSI